MLKFNLILLFFITSLSASASDFIVTLPNQNKVLSMLSTYTVCWSDITLNNISHEIAGKNFSQASLEKYLLKKMFGDTNTKCAELSLAAQAIISQSSPAIELTN